VDNSFFLPLSKFKGANLFFTFILFVMFIPYQSILFPISIPGLVVVIIWQFTNIWNEFLFAVTVTSEPTKQPITIALVNLADSQVVEWNIQMAGALFAALPTVIVYILLGKYFLRGLLRVLLKDNY